MIYTSVDLQNKKIFQTHTQKLTFPSALKDMD